MGIPGVLMPLVVESMSILVPQTATSLTGLLPVDDGTQINGSVTTND